MQKKLMAWKTRGMNQDLSVSAFNPEFSFENMNLRLSSNDNNTQLSWVNEQGTSSLYFKDDSDEEVYIIGVPIGCAVINHQLILFVTNSGATPPDHIYMIKKDETIDPYFRLTELYGGILGFSTNNPIETLTSYESELVQKVYWTDGEKQPRVINVAASATQKAKWNDNYFDFIPTLKLEETVTVVKQLSGSGMFAPGVIQYAFTYYNKYGQESNIFYTTPLQYISYKDRGASPEDKVENAFKITVNNVDTHFDYLRIYSIQRTSIDGTPICKRIQDIAVDGLTDRTASFIDTGTTGESIDPTELLYKGGEIISAQTMEQKDNTLFFGNIKITRPEIKDYEDTIKEAISIDNTTIRRFKATFISSKPYTYYNQLTSQGINRDNNKTVPCCGFKTGDYYRLGVQFQHESGKWSDPIHITDAEGNDYMAKGKSSENAGTVEVPNFTGSISDSEETNKVITKLKEAGYRRIRPVVVFPNIIDRESICQGVINPTLYTQTQREDDKDVYAQSSWFFRPYQEADNTATEAVNDTINVPKSLGKLHYTQNNVNGDDVFDPKYIRKVEIEGDFDSENQFEIDRFFRTLHSPDIEFDEQLSLLDFTDATFKRVGAAHFINTMSDINIQTESPTISNSGSGFIHKAFTGSSNTNTGAAGIIAGLFYDDFIVDDTIDEDEDEGENYSFRSYLKEHTSAKWLIYPWQSNGSLNNDINRPSDKGNATAILKKKVISNLRYADTTLIDYDDREVRQDFADNTIPQLFSGEEDTILKMGNKIYKGNIDTVLTPDKADGKYFAMDSADLKFLTAPNPAWYISFGWDTTPFDSTAWLKTFSTIADQAFFNGIRVWAGLSEFQVREWVWTNDDIGNEYVDLSIRKSPVRMKYKSTSHLVASFRGNYNFNEDDNELAIIEVQKATSHDTRFGGKSKDALRGNIWLPCGESVSLDNANAEGNVEFYYDYGDTYFQRYDCLKTYPFTREDPNQIVEIGSFMLETHVNIDGRYDRNRGQSNNLNMSPQNFNLLNMVYSQKDNFFTYRIQDDDLYKNNSYTNQITWSKTKQNNADTDLWNNVTLASTLELDGDKGEVISLNRLNDQLICFQDQGISQILYNENTQISTTEGVPIEIANSGKVQGKRYLSDTIGCSNKWSICPTPVGLYFIDSIGKNIFQFNGQLNNLSTSLGFNAWAKQHIPDQSVKWEPVGFNNFRTHYDMKNQDVLFVNQDIALAYSEKFSCFTSFYDYGDAPWFANLDGLELWFTASDLDRYAVWKHQHGNYGEFFGVKKPYWMTLVGNPEPQMDKIFTNLEFRAGINMQNEGDQNYLPFTFLETWNEYQHGFANIDYRSDHAAFQHHKEDGTASLKRKFRIFRCDIPRNNCLLDSDRVGSEPYSTDEDLNISRFTRKPMDRMRNPWLYLKLYHVKADYRTHLRRTEIHDLVMTYYS